MDSKRLADVGPTIGAAQCLTADLMKLVQISDTHLSPSKSHLYDNWEPRSRWIMEQKADLKVHTGDLSVDGAGHDDDLAFSMERVRSLPVSVLLLSGNHDVGHLHTAAKRRLDGTALVWAPASSFVVGPMERDMPDRRMLGTVVHIVDNLSRVVEGTATPDAALHDAAEQVQKLLPRH